MKDTFRTECNVSPVAHQISMGDQLITMGSCFSDVMGNRLSNYKFSTRVNPFGTVYNPISIFDLLCSTGWDEGKFVEMDGVYYHHDAHSCFNATTKDKLTDALMQAKKAMEQKRKEVQWVIITLGTSYVYRLKETHKIVANCHKVPQRYFEKELLKLEEVEAAFDQCYTSLRKENPSLKFVFTVSPVRHTKDGLEGNAVSKALLRIACERFCQYPGVFYFPAYEIMNDDLRDYRFYKEDMIHPTALAEQYIWEKFQHAFLEDAACDFIKEWTKIRDALNHKPFNPVSEAHQRFLKNTLTKLKQYEGKVDVADEIDLLKKQIL